MAKSKTWVVWTTREEKLLREVHASDRPLKEMMHLFPNRTLKSVSERMNFLRLGPRKHVDRSAQNPSFRWQEICRLMQTDVELTTHEIANRISCAPSWVLALIKRARKAAETKPMYIARWRRARPGDSMCCWVEVWAWGDGPDAPKPRVPTHAEQVRFQRLRKLVREEGHVASPFEMGRLIKQAA
ncbi:hypothetical protein [Paraburkholderia sacchari]|uniref:hypothetical protein n=1 Tax=Paraburkholderia sacchari TaxID=159450 RepID=UPI001BCEA3B3|nr:hypothetical protein [Paraburkholderia sacchari]